MRIASIMILTVIAGIMIGGSIVGLLFTLGRLSSPLAQVMVGFAGLIFIGGLVRVAFWVLGGVLGSRVLGDTARNTFTSFFGNK